MEYDDIVIDGQELQIDSGLLEGSLPASDEDLPERICIIPIRSRPIFPGIVTPLIISKRFIFMVDKAIQQNNKVLGLILVRDDEKDDIKAKDLYKYGTAVKIIKKVNLPDGSVNVLINSLQRFRVDNMNCAKKLIMADVKYVYDKKYKKDIEVKALTREILSKIRKLSESNPMFTEEIKLTVLNVDAPGKIADFVTSILNVEKHEYQDVLETVNVKKRLGKVLGFLRKEMELMEIQEKIQGKINDRLDKQQKEFFLREQIRAIRQELGGEEDDRMSDVTKLKEKALSVELKPEVMEKINEELDKLNASEHFTAEYSIVKTYIESVLSLPWNTSTVDKIDLKTAEKTLNKDHYGLEDVKKRIIEFLAVKKLNPDSKGSIICLMGPPGVGKTSLGKSIANTMNRKFFRVSLGGMRDEAEIKGHRRTYIGAMPGKIMQGIKIVKSKNPVFMLDEIDKLGYSYQGDPGSALLEVLDSEQNNEFRDHYLDVPFDLSNVLFITTANTSDTIPTVLLDRMEIIEMSGYIAEEKIEIAKRYLLPKQLKLHGLKKNHIMLDNSGYNYIIEGWARESGVRNLERQIEKICRKTAAKVVSEIPMSNSLLNKEAIREYLGPEIHTDPMLLNDNMPGIARGLAWTSLGGTITTIESLVISSKEPGLKITGQLGDVMTESVNIAYSYVRNLLRDSKAAITILNQDIIHIHVPSGATPKDGPSAGITMACSIYSLITGKKIKKNIAMTGELSLTGAVLPVGGIKEKIVASRRAKMKMVIIPEQNKSDLEKVPANIQKGIEFKLVNDMKEVIGLAFD